MAEAPTLLKVLLTERHMQPHPSSVVSMRGPLDVLIRLWSQRRQVVSSTSGGYPVGSRLSRIPTTAGSWYACFQDGRCWSCSARTAHPRRVRY
jgi:hypothetical protein